VFFLLRPAFASFPLLIAPPPPFQFLFQRDSGSLFPIRTFPSFLMFPGHPGPFFRDTSVRFILFSPCAHWCVPKVKGLTGPLQTVFPLEMRHPQFPTRQPTNGNVPSPCVPSLHGHFSSLFFFRNSWRFAPGMRPPKSEFHTLSLFPLRRISPPGSPKDGGLPLSYGPSRETNLSPSPKLATTSS